MRFIVHDDGQQAILEGIIAEDVCKGGADDSAEPVAGQRPGGVFAARTAPKVVSG